MRPEFAVHTLNPNGHRKACAIAQKFDNLLDDLTEIVQPTADPAVGRALSLVKTHLEEACFYAKKLMASIPENQEG